MEQWLFWSWQSWWQITRRSRWPWEDQRDYALVSMTVHRTCFARSNFFMLRVLYMKNEKKVLLLRYYKILNLQSWETSPNQLRPWEIWRYYALISAVHSAQPPTRTTTTLHNHQPEIFIHFQNSSGKKDSHTCCMIAGLSQTIINITSIFPTKWPFIGLSVGIAV